MEPIFETVTGQYVDLNGKTRIIVCDYRGQSIPVFISPIPPLSVAIIKKESIKPASIDVIIKFMKAISFVATEQEGTERGTRGIWAEPEDEHSILTYIYVPTVVYLPETVPSIESLPFTKRKDPIRTDSVKNSELEIFRKNRKLAEVLKQYTLYTYAMNPDDFSEAYFWVDPDHLYDLDKLGNRLFVEDNDVIYRDGYIIVPTEATKLGLMSYLSTSTLNDRPGVMAMADSKTIDNYYQTISDFRNVDHQLIFVNRNGLNRWREESIKKITTGPVVLASPMEDTQDPYYYKNPEIRNDTLMIIQNVSNGTLDRAVTVSNYWKTKRQNIGWRAPAGADWLDISYIIFDETGEVSRTKKKTKYVPIFRYENGTLAAILFID